VIVRHDVDIKADSAVAVKASVFEGHGGQGAASVLLKLHDGSEHSIAHLAGMDLACPCKPIERELMIRVAFKNHCYTEDYDPEKHQRHEILITEAKNRHRVFCPIRYALSHRLPKILAGLPNGKVHQTAQVRNYVFVVPLEVDGEFYEVYFMLQRAAPDDKADLRLTVESAYPNGATNIRKRPRTIRFMVLAHKVLTNQSVRFAPR
jgi:hypothetical protein